MSDTGRSLPLTDISQDERAFRQLVRVFAEKKIRTVVHEMDE